MGFVFDVVYQSSSAKQGVVQPTNSMSTEQQVLANHKQNMVGLPRNMCDVVTLQVSSNGSKVY